MEQLSQVLGDQEIPQSGRSYWEAWWTPVATEELGVCFDADFFLEGFSQIAQNNLELRVPRNMLRLKKWNLWSTKHYKFVRWNFCSNLRLGCRLLLRKSYQSGRGSDDRQWWSHSMNLFEFHGIKESNKTFIKSKMGQPPIVPLIPFHLLLSSH